MAKTFDVDGARKAGYGDHEIAHYLVSTGRSEDEVHEHLGTNPGQDEGEGGQPAEKALDPGTKSPDVETPAAPVHKFSSTQIALPKALMSVVKKMAAKIPDSDLAEDGREDDPHVTVLYGIHSGDPKGAASLLAKEPPIRAKLGKVSIFPDSGSGDVVKIEVDSDDLHRLNEKLAGGLEHTSTHPDYTPHVTVAYVKPGMGAKYAGTGTLKGLPFTAKSVEFSSRDGNKTDMPLGGKSGSAPSENKAPYAKAEEQK